MKKLFILIVLILYGCNNDNINSVDSNDITLKAKLDSLSVKYDSLNTRFIMMKSEINNFSLTLLMDGSTPQYVPVKLQEIIKKY